MRKDERGNPVRENHKIQFNDTMYTVIVVDTGLIVKNVNRKHGVFIELSIESSVEGCIEDRRAETRG